MATTSSIGYRHRPTSSSLSFPYLLNERSIGNIRRPDIFYKYYVSATDGLCHNIKLLSDIEVYTPHHDHYYNINNNSRGGGGITSLDMDVVENRFLLVGGHDAMISVYDLSYWGSESYLTTTTTTGTNNRNMRRKPGSSSIHKPVAQSTRARAAAVPIGGEDNNDIVTGHTSSIVSAKWYPNDTGAFVSGSVNDGILVWDTNAMQPVVQYKPFQNSGGLRSTNIVNNRSRAVGGGVHCFDMSNHTSSSSRSSICCGSRYSNEIKLVDIRSGSSSHTLTGHNGYVTALQWCRPTCSIYNEFILVSGSSDGTIRLWDIRKSGSNSCITIFDRDFDNNNNISCRYYPSYKHLRNQRQAMKRQIPKPSTPRSSKTIAKTASRKSHGYLKLAPSNYSETNSTNIQSHDGPISSLSFTNDGQYLVSTCRKDGQIYYWDLRCSNGAGLIPINFSSSYEVHKPPIETGSSTIINSNVPIQLMSSSSSLTNNTNNIVWVANHSKILGFDMHLGGPPIRELTGHLNRITCMTKVNSTDNNNSSTKNNNIFGDDVLISGSTDGMILLWGACKRTKKQNTFRRHHNYTTTTSRNKYQSNNSNGKLKRFQGSSEEEVSSRAHEDHDNW